MFSRLRNTVRVLSYREPTHVPDLVIRAASSPQPTKSGTKIAAFLQFVLVVYAIGLLVGPVLHIVETMMAGLTGKHPTASVTAMAGGLGAILAILASRVRSKIEDAVHSHLHVDGIVAPYVGHKLDNAYRVLRGNSRVS